MARAGNKRVEASPDQGNEIPAGLDRSERKRQLDTRREKAVAQGLGMTRLHEKFQALAAKYAAEIEAGTFPAGEALDLGIGMTDAPLRSEAHDRLDKDRVKMKDRPEHPMLTGDAAAAFETEQHQAYLTAVEAHKAAERDLKTTSGPRGILSRSKESQLRQKVKDMQGSESLADDELDRLEELPGLRKLQGVLASQGYAVRAVKEGPVWKFSAEPVPIAPEPVPVETVDNMGIDPQIAEQLREQGRHSAEVRIAEAQARAEAAEREEARNQEMQALREQVEQMQRDFERRLAEKDAKHDREHQIFRDALKIGVTLAKGGDAPIELPN